MKFQHQRIHSLLSLCLLVCLACTPTITLGLGIGEIAVILILAIVLIGPVIFGLIRRLTHFTKDKE